LVPQPPGTLLRIVVEPTVGRGPYALRRGGGLYFFVRTQDRVRPLGWDEVRRGFVEHAGREDEERRAELQVVTDLRQRRAKVRDGLWLRLAPLEAPDARLSEEQARDLLMRADATGNRESGWNFVNPYVAPQRDGLGWRT